jgi:short-subunit dehydrogenase
MSDETVLITGASSGIGLELTRLFAAAGSDLVLVARREDRLGEIADELRANHDITVRVLPADLSQPAAAVAIFEVLSGAGIDIDILVNNAGFGARGSVADLSINRQVQMMQVNMTSLVELTRRLLPGMIQRGGGGILNVASTASFQPGPYMAVYYASKAFVLSFTEGLAGELAKTDIRVTCLAPGPVATGFGAIAGVDDTVLFKAGVLDASKVAWAGYQGLRRGKTLVVPGLRNKFTVLAARLLPRSLIRRMVAMIQK